MTRRQFFLFLIFFSFFDFTHSAHAALTLTAGSNATTTPNVATSITGFQIVGPAASTTPVQLRATSGTLSMTTTTGLTFDGSSSGSTVNFSGTVANINAALATLKYTRASTGTDTLEVSLVNKGEIFYTANNHLYKFISGSYSWSAAKTAAEAQTAYGATGYLVTITSSGENSFVSARLTGDGWIGASDSGVEGTWKWMTGPEATQSFWQGTSGGSTVNGMYQAWAGGEPNQSGDEDCAETYVSSGTWNDFPCGASLGYVVEFGADGNMPTVVATNISIVTADVPAITTLSPSNGSTSVSPTANLVIGFSKTVTKQTGNILIKKTSDNSTVETIDASGDLLSGSGTNTITINPSTTLAEGTQFYVTVPSTAFKDSSNNYFEGITNSSTWTFTTSDITAPSITNIATSTATTTATISWTTNESASTRLWYSADSVFASSTTETDTSSRVTSHEVSLSGLIACTLYNFKAVSRDAAANSATSTASSFITKGCQAGLTPLSSTSTLVTVNTSATSTLVEDGRTLSVQTPANFTATSSTVVIQIKGMTADPVLDSIGKPSNTLSSAASIVFNVTALVNNTTVLDSFDSPVTVSYQYTDEDISGLDESTLKMYHYRDSSWAELDDCTVNVDSNTITCTAPHFSIFAIFGTPPAASGSLDGGTNLPGRVKNLIQQGKVAEANVLKAEKPWLFPKETQVAAIVTSGITQSSIAMSSVRDLKIGMTGEDVFTLQKFLNDHGYSLALTGPGSSGNETSMFGSLTRDALSKFQAANSVNPAIGYFGPLTRAKIKELGLRGTWW